MSVSREDALKIVRDLAEGYSKQSKDSNRLWLASIAGAAVVVFPTHSLDDKTMVNLPFSLGAVPSSIFEPVGFFILFILFMAYCQAYAHAHNADYFSQRRLDELERNNPKALARDFYDNLVASSFARVWPLVYLLRISCGGALKTVQLLYYVLLKFLTTVILLGIPLTALWVSYRPLLEASPTLILVASSFALMFTTVAVAQIVFAEFQHGSRVITKLQKLETNDAAG
jgi:hypothetical protein